jgi:hypothetical protein
MSNSIHTTLANSPVSSELPASPDAGVTKTVAALVAATAEYSSGVKGAVTFNKAYRAAKRASAHLADEAGSMLIQLEGAVTAFFGGRPATTAATIAEFTLSEINGDRVMKAVSRIRVRDEVLGKCVIRLSVSVVEDGRKQVHGSVRSTRWWETDRIMGTFDGFGERAVERAIAEFAQWAALQDY